ncbi:hypothetical protein IAE19_13815 [Acinetobacter sp. S40]|uniref:hypothetical protein n=1 Tax=unclassified Acinetobacter TaxID=196816 RepID=UPI00190DB5A8|nr:MULTISPECIES: hypothetical protein [unclassified Acinetobacter]MBJ9986507.1 hypothetical protein [Acinetobacter sp. S40]MBK0064746.1 hypothetical protein [Acinetobacter sp. S55]MBK0068109.1 hypothetical protein [Acinetobacter sp. S54]
MLKHALYSATLSLAIILPISASATESPTSPSDQPKTMPYGDNPNIFRVLTYKTGESISRLGNSIQRGADKSSAKISEKWQETKTYGSEQSQVAQEKATEAKTYTEQKWQQTKDAVVGTNGGTVPIEQGSLTQSSTVPTPAVAAPIAPASSISSATSTAPLPESANP